MKDIMKQILGPNNTALLDLNIPELQRAIAGTATEEESIRVKNVLRKIKLSNNVDSIKKALEDSIINKENRLYYYVDLSVFVNCIVEKNQTVDKKISLLAGHCDYMNDSDEFNAGYNIIAKNKNISERISASIKELKDTVPFIISFSQAKDSLPMWHVYGKNAEGIMLCFDMKMLKSRFYGRMKSSIYNNSDRYVAFADLILNPEKYLPQNTNQIENGNMLEIFQKALEWFPFIAKNGYFEYEKEVRLTRIEWSDKDTTFIPKHGLLCPYRRLYFPADSLKEVYLSPKASSDLTMFSLRRFLDQNELKSVEIIKSKIPYRG